MAKLKGHSEKIFLPTQTNIQYNPKLAFVEQRTDKGIMKFEKMPKREIKFEVKPQYLRNSVDYNKLQKGYKMIEKKNAATLFGHSKFFIEKLDSFGLPKFLVVLFIHIYRD